MALSAAKPNVATCKRSAHNDLRAVGLRLRLGANLQSHKSALC